MICKQCGISPVKLRTDRKVWFCSRRCANRYNGLVKHQIAETNKIYPLCACGCGGTCRQTISKYRPGHNPISSHPGLKGPDNPNWRGGKPKRIHSSLHHREFRKAVFERDNYTCQKCLRRGVNIHAHHIIPVSVDKTKIRDIDNGITLCHNCHWDTHREMTVKKVFVDA